MDDDDLNLVRAQNVTSKTRDIVDRIEQIPATTLPGLLVKINASLWCQNELTQPDHGDRLFEATTLEMGLGNEPPTTNARILASLLNDMVAIGRART